MRELVREDAGELVAVERFHQRRRHSDDRMLRVTSRRERVRHVAFDDGDARHRQTGALREGADDRTELRRLRRRHILRFVGTQHERRAEPVCEAIDRERHDKHHRRPPRPARCAADSDHEPREERHQDHCFQRIHLIHLIFHKIFHARRSQPLPVVCALHCGRKQRRQLLDDIKKEDSRNYPLIFLWSGRGESNPPL